MECRRFTRESRQFSARLCHPVQHSWRRVHAWVDVPSSSTYSHRVAHGMVVSTEQVWFALVLLQVHVLRYVDSGCTVVWWTTLSLWGYLVPFASSTSSRLVSWSTSSFSEFPVVLIDEPQLWCNPKWTPTLVRCTPTVIMHSSEPPLHLHSHPHPHPHPAQHSPHPPNTHHSPLTTHSTPPPPPPPPGAILFKADFLPWSVFQLHMAPAIDGS